jgi:hypothetical protein
MPGRKRITLPGLYGSVMILAGFPNCCRLPAPARAAAGLATISRLARRQDSTPIAVIEMSQSACRQ